MDTDRSGRPTEALALRRVLAILRRRWWIILAAALIAPAVAVAASATQTPVYESSADVLLSYQNLAGSLTGTADSASVAQDPERAAATQAELARVPEVARRTLARTGQADREVKDFLESSSVSASASSDLLTFRVRDEDPLVAAASATRYADSFIDYRLELDTAAINRARGELQERIAQLREQGAEGSALYGSLVEKDQTLQTLQSLQTSNALRVREGSEAQQVSPKLVRNGFIGLAFGILVGVAFAFLREALDTTVRSADEISEGLGLTLLARLPEPSRRLRAAGRLAMLDDPTGTQAEAFRMLRTNIEFVDLDRRSRVIAVTSAINDEGKSTTAANLALAFARAGSRVILVDLDLRRPTIHTFFGLADDLGASDVLLGETSLEAALEPVALDGGGSGAAHRNGAPGRSGALDALPSGPVPRDASQLVGSPALGALLSDLRLRSDLVIVDTPPLLRVGDTMAMSVHFDALIVVARLGLLSRHAVSETARLLRRMRATALGVVVTGAQDGEDYSGYYGYGGSSAPAQDPSRRIVR